MSVPHRSLQDRLNAIKDGNPVPQPQDNNFTMQNNKNIQKNNEKFDYKKFFVVEGYKLFNVLSVSILYGYGANAILSQGWSFIECFGVGILINHLATGVIRRFFSKNK